MKTERVSEKALTLPQASSASPSHSDNTLLSPQGPKLDGHNARQDQSKQSYCRSQRLPEKTKQELTHSVRGAWCNAAARSQSTGMQGCISSSCVCACVCVWVSVRASAAVVSCLCCRQELLSPPSWSWLSFTSSHFPILCPAVSVSAPTSSLAACSPSISCPYSTFLPNQLNRKIPIWWVLNLQMHFALLEETSIKKQSTKISSNQTSALIYFLPVSKTRTVKDISLLSLSPSSLSLYLYFSLLLFPSLSLKGPEGSEAENQLFCRIVVCLTHRGIFVIPHCPTHPHSTQNHTHASTYTHTHTHGTNFLFKSFFSPLIDTIIHLTKRKHKRSLLIRLSLPRLSKHTVTRVQRGMCLFVRLHVPFSVCFHRQTSWWRSVMRLGPCDSHLDWFSVFGCSSEQNNCYLLLLLLPLFSPHNTYKQQVKTGKTLWLS